MDRLKRFAARKPVAFSLGILVLFVLVLFASTILSNRWPLGTAGWYLGGIIGRFIGISFLLLLVARLGWLQSAGFTRLGRFQTWLFMLLPLAYAIAASAISMTGGFDFSLSGSWLTAGAAAFILIAAFLEEVVFRGLILHTFVRAWGGARRSLITGVLVSSILFALFHWINLLDGTPLAEVALQSLVAFSLGVMLASLLLRARSIYPAFMFHALLNLAGYLNFASKGIQSSLSGWLTLSLLMLPLAAVGLFLCATQPQPVAQQQSALREELSNP